MRARVLRLEGEGQRVCVDSAALRCVSWADCRCQTSFNWTQSVAPLITNVKQTYAATPSKSVVGDSLEDVIDWYEIVGEPGASERVHLAIAPTFATL